MASSINPLSIQAIQNFINNNTNFQITPIQSVFNSFAIMIHNMFYVKFSFTEDGIFFALVVHSYSELNLQVEIMSSTNTFKILTIFFSNMLKYFLEKDKFNGFNNFLTWLNFYQKLFQVPCSKCQQFFCCDENHSLKDIQSELKFTPEPLKTLPPILYDIKGQPFHVQCWDHSTIPIPDIS